MIDLSKYRIIDLSRELVPGELKLDGRYLHGDHQWGRQIELQEFKAFEAPEEKQDGGLPNDWNNKPSYPDSNGYCTR